MKRSIITLILIAVAIVFFPSCHSKSGHKVEERSKAEQAHVADSIARAKEVKRVATYKFTFTPTKIEVLGPVEEKTTCGDTDYSCKSFTAAIKFFKGDSVYIFNFDETESLVPSIPDVSTTHAYNDVKAAFNLMVNTELQSFRVSVDEGLIKSVTIKGAPTGKVGKYNSFKKDITFNGHFY